MSTENEHKTAPEFSAPPTRSERIRRVGDVVERLHAELPAMANTSASADSITAAIENLETAVLRGLVVKKSRA